MLKIDLLPRHFAIARTNKRILVGAVVFLFLVAVGLLFQYNSIGRQIAATEKRIAEVEPIAQEVDEIQAEISEKQGWLDPISGKIDFIKRADETGEEFFDRFHTINEYIWEEAEMSSFSISGSSVNFTVDVRGTTGVARFLLNLLRCPDISNISYSGGVSGGQSIGVIGAAGVEPGSPNEPFGLQISATLTKPVSIPTPPGQAVATAGMGSAMGMGPPGMRPGMMPGPPGAGAGEAGGEAAEGEEGAVTAR